MLGYSALALPSLVGYCVCMFLSVTLRGPLGEVPSARSIPAGKAL